MSASNSMSRCSAAPRNFSNSHVQNCEGTSSTRDHSRGLDGNRDTYPRKVEVWCRSRAEWVTAIVVPESPTVHQRSRSGDRRSVSAGRRNTSNDRSNCNEDSNRTARSKISDPNTSDRVLVEFYLPGMGRCRKSLSVTSPNLREVMAGPGNGSVVSAEVHAATSSSCRESRGPLNDADGDAYADAETKDDDEDVQFVCKSTGNVGVSLRNTQDVSSADYGRDEVAAFRQASDRRDSGARDDVGVQVQRSRVSVGRADEQDSGDDRNVARYESGFTNDIEQDPESVNMDLIQEQLRESRANIQQEIARRRHQERLRAANARFQAQQENELLSNNERQAAMGRRRQGMRSSA
eukprot:TRINITY_DN68449_c0_g1_i1.p1 TRINITY_DN68449_c0_g1~~TRINITY_DN68449_c0_g1_i1.p1  ORF type:complete len:350 (-),score=43.11 TRINITY_DN68449_c0_g1_i1:139-1188(-)